MRVVLAPPYLCCGFPHRANAKIEPHERIALRDTIVFAQIREMFAYLSFDAVIVTCGTCREALGQLEAGRIFGAPVVDLARISAMPCCTGKRLHWSRRHSGIRTSRSC